MQATTSYDPWGTPQTPLTDSFGFTGELHDGDLVHLRVRWYHPSIGTFTARDPFAGFDNLPYSLHSYQYAYSNPVLLTDPSGEVAGALTIGGTAVSAGICAASVVCGIVAGVVIVAAAAGTAYVACQNEVLICQDEAAPTSLQRIDAGAAPAPPRHTGNHTPAPVTPPSPPMTLPQELPPGTTPHSAPWEMDESLVCSQEGFPMTEAEDFKVTIFPAPEKGGVPVFMAEEGGTITNYTPADQAALEEFGQAASAYQAARQMRSFGTNWPFYPNVYSSDEIYLYKEGDQVKAAMVMQVVENFGMQVVYVRSLESIQRHGGSKLMRHALEQSIAQNLDGVIGKPADQSLGFYVQYGAVPLDEEFYFLDRSKIQQALSQLPE